VLSWARSGLEDELSWHLPEQLYWLWRGSKGSKEGTEDWHLWVCYVPELNEKSNLYYVDRQCNCQNT
jgi:hypothetical protein